VKLEEARAGVAESKSNAAGEGMAAKMKAAAVPGGPLAGAGFHGRLGDLGSIDSQYDVAVSTAGGGALGNLVVDTLEGSRLCLEFIKVCVVARREHR